jgi:hypothetical protein
MNRFLLPFLIVMAAAANAVPSHAALHPQTAALGLAEEDLTGCGRETWRKAPQLRVAANDNADAAVGDARRWRDLAARARRAAGWVSVRDEALLTSLAEEYEARAQRAEDRQGIGA